jgi:hypothetical protein
VGIIPVGKVFGIAGKFVKAGLSLSSDAEKLIVGSFRAMDDMGVAGKEIITATKSGSYVDAKAVMKDVLGNFGDDATEYISRTKGPFEGKVVGYKSGSKGWRVDWDASKGAHINWWDGKTKGAIPFTGGLEKAKSMVENKVF